MAAAAARGAWLLRADELGRAAEDPRRRRRLPPAVAARGSRITAASRAQSFLQGARELDRLPPDSRRLRTRSARPRHDHLQRRPAGWAFDRRPDLVLGGAAAFCWFARRPACVLSLPVRSFHPLGNLDHPNVRSGLSLP